MRLTEQTLDEVIAEAMKRHMDRLAAGMVEDMESASPLMRALVAQTKQEIAAAEKPTTPTSGNT